MSNVEPNYLVGSGALFISVFAASPPLSAPLSFLPPFLPPFFSVFGASAFAGSLAASPAGAAATVRGLLTCLLAGVAARAEPVMRAKSDRPIIVLRIIWNPPVSMVGRKCDVPGDCSPGARSRRAANPAIPARKGAPRHGREAVSVWPPRKSAPAAAVVQPNQ